MLMTERKKVALPGEDENGLVCPRCGCRHFWTTHTYREPGQIRRRKECRHCGFAKHSVEKFASGRDHK